MNNDKSSNSGTMANRIYEAIYNSEPEIIKYTPDALVRVLVHLAYSNDWGIEKLENETLSAIKYYYCHEEVSRHVSVNEQ